MLFLVIDHVDPSVLVHPEDIEDPDGCLLALLIVGLVDLSRAYVRGKAVLILIFVIVETLVRDDLCNGKSPVTYNADSDLTALQVLFDKDHLLV